jgi:hypothetical protein
MSNDNTFILGRLSAAVRKIDQLGNLSGPSRRLDLSEAVGQLLNDVTRESGTLTTSVDFDSIAQRLIGLESGRRVAAAVGARELDGTAKYENQDPGWIKCLLEYVSSHPVDFPIAPPGSAIYPLEGSGKITIALAGDWGTNNDPAKSIAERIKALNPDYSIHLGDVYYAGDPKDEKENLNDLWPRGRFGAFALNSNHEMYCGGVGYFQTIRDQKFANRGFSYFALTNDAWLIIGLDTAYWGHNQSVLYEDGYIADATQAKGTAQLDWLQHLLSNPEHAHKRLIILTHHDGFDVDVGIVKEKKLFKVIKDAVGNNRDLIWYWGHVHAGIAYNPIPLPGNRFLRARCVGHGGVPYPPFGVLSSYGSPPHSIAWAEQEKATTGDTRRALNGYMTLTLEGNRITEEFYAESRVPARWSASS